MPFDIKLFDAELAKKCTSRHPYHTGLSTNLPCIKSAKMLVDALHNGEKIEDTIIQNFYIHLKHKCISSICSGGNCIPNALYLQVQPPVSHIQCMFRFNYRSYLIQKIFKKYTYSFTSANIQTLIQHWYGNKGRSISNLKDYVYSNYVIDEDVSILLGYKFHKLHVSIGMQIDKSTVDFEYTTEMLNKTCQALPESKPSFFALLGKDIKLDVNCLTTTFKYCVVENVKYILGLCEFDINLIDDDNGHFMSMLNRFSEKKVLLQMALEKGYKLKYNDIYYGIQLGFIIPDLEKWYSKPLDNKLLKLCKNKKTYPVEYNFDCISKDMVGLYCLMDNTDLDVIRDYIKNHNLIPDEHCFDICTPYADMEKLGLIVEYGGIPTIQNIINAVGKYSPMVIFMKTVLEKHHERRTKRIILLEKNYNELQKLAYKPIIFQQKYICKVPRKKMPSTPIYREFFQSKQEKVSFLEIKRTVLEMVSEHGWKEQNMIVLPIDTLEMLGLTIGKINIDDIDNLIQILYE